MSQGIDKKLVACRILSVAQVKLKPASCGTLGITLSLHMGGSI